MYWYIFIYRTRRKRQMLEKLDSQQNTKIYLKNEILKIRRQNIDV